MLSAKKVFARAEQNCILNCNEMCEARDFLITSITLKTGTRPGELENLKMREFSDAQTDPTTGHKVLLVPQHNRQSDGPAPLAIDSELDHLMQIYVKYIVPQFPPPRGAAFFLRYNGTPFQEGAINKRLPEFWKKSGIRPDIRVTATNIRKWIVTTCNNVKRSGVAIDEETLRRSMCHSDKVAKTCYLRDDLTAVAASAMNIIARCTLQEGSSEEEQMTAKEKDDSRPPSRQSLDGGGPSVLFAKPDREHVSSSEKSRLVTDEKDDSRPPSRQSLEQVTPSDLRRLTTNQKEAITNHYKNLIESSKKILTADVSFKMKHDPTLRKICNNERMVKKVLDRVRNLQYKHQEATTSQPDDLPKTEPQEETRQWVDTQSLASSSSTRMDWTQDETDIIEKNEK